MAKPKLTSTKQLDFCNEAKNPKDKGRRRKSKSKNNILSWVFSILIALVPLLFYSLIHSLVKGESFLCYLCSDIGLIVCVFSFMASCMFEWDTNKVMHRIMFIIILCLVGIYVMFICFEVFQKSFDMRDMAIVNSLTFFGCFILCGINILVDSKIICFHKKK